MDHRNFSSWFLRSHSRLRVQLPMASGKRSEKEVKKIAMSPFVRCKKTLYKRKHTKKLFCAIAGHITIRSKGVLQDRYILFASYALHAFLLISPVFCFEV